MLHTSPARCAINDSYGRNVVVSIEKIIRKFTSLDEYLAVLRKLADTPVEEFIRDKILNRTIIMKRFL